LSSASLPCTLTRLQFNPAAGKESNTGQMEIACMSCKPSDALLLVTPSYKQWKRRGRSLPSQWELTSVLYSTDAPEALAAPVSLVR
jgi:hypothetical protein